MESIGYIDILKKTIKCYKNGYFKYGYTLIGSPEGEYIVVHKSTSPEGEYIVVHKPTETKLSKLCFLAGIDYRQTSWLFLIYLNKEQIEKMIEILKLVYGYDKVVYEES